MGGAGGKEPKRFRDLMRRARRDRDASRVVVSIIRADARVTRVLDRALAGAGLTPPQFVVLMELASSPGAALPLYELNERLTSSPPNMSWLAGKMESSGLVDRTRSRGDRRVVIVRLTEQGWEHLAAAAPLVFAAEKELLGIYSRDELHQLARLLARLLD